MKVDRLLAIVMIMLNKPKVTAKELADYFEVSVRTIQRDLEAINIAGIPIVSYQGYNGGYGIMDSYKIDANFFTSDEFSLMVSTLKGLDKLLGKEVDPILNKIGTIHKNISSNHIMMDFSSWGMNPSTPKKIHLINEAVQNSKVIQFKYVDMNGCLSDREIEPLMLVLKQNAWYIYGYCLLRKNFRLFKLTRLNQLEVTNQSFLKKELPDDFMNETYTLESNIKLKLKFDKSVSSRIYDSYDLEDITTLSDGSIIVEVNFREDEWVYGMILSYGDNVEVLEPDHIKEIIVNRAKKIINIYD